MFDNFVDTLAKGGAIYEVTDVTGEYKQTGNKGTGKGTDVVLFFSPEMWRNQQKPVFPGANVDEVLFHELVHASRQTRGVQDSSYVDNDYDDSEEYLAVVLTNIYMSEKGQLVMVGNHGTKPLQGPERDNFINNSQHTLLAPQQLMQNFKDSQRAFYDALANLPATIKWNPVRQHNEFRRQHDTTPFF